jgi:hypothetical protein
LLDHSLSTVRAKYKKSFNFGLLHLFFKQKPENSSHAITMDALFLSTQKIDLPAS